MSKPTKEKLERHPCGNKITKKHSKWRRWAKNQRNRLIRRSKNPEIDVKLKIGSEY